MRCQSCFYRLELCSLQQHEQVHSARQSDFDEHVCLLLATDILVEPMLPEASAGDEHVCLLPATEILVEPMLHEAGAGDSFCDLRWLRQTFVLLRAY